jgi:hypothetical protein
MSSALLRAHGGSKVMTGTKGQIVSTSMFVKDTMAGAQKTVSKAHLGNLVANTIGEPSGRPVMDGVLTETTQGHKSKDVPEIHKVSGKGKTQPQRMGQVPYGGKNY